MGLIRIGNKTISKHKIHQTIDRILEMRDGGMSQADTAREMGTDRSFISRLESLGEVRKGERVAFVAFPVENKDEINRLLDQYGVDFRLVMTEQERLAFVKDRSGIELTNDICELIARTRQHDILIVFASDKRGKLIKTLVDCCTILKDIGTSPITRDVYIPPEEVREILDAILF